MNLIDEYVSQLQTTLNELPQAQILEAVELLHKARVSRRKVLIMGNGGSAATASHMVCDFMKNTRRMGLPDFRIVGLADNMPVFSALANDEGYENVFSGQMASLVEPDDVVVAISASGNSPNVLKAVELANRMGAHTIGLTGYDGGKLGKMVGLNLLVPSNVIEHVEDVHMMLDHVLTTLLRSADSPEWSPREALANA